MDNAQKPLTYADGKAQGANDLSGYLYQVHAAVTAKLESPQGAYVFGTLISTAFVGFVLGEAADAVAERMIAAGLPPVDYAPRKAAPVHRNPLPVHDAGRLPDHDEVGQYRG